VVNRKISVACITNLEIIDFKGNIFTFENFEAKGTTFYVDD
jgi:hypothetical protein